jgi:hypothetical protein
MTKEEREACRLLIGDWESGCDEDRRHAIVYRLAVSVKHALDHADEAEKVIKELCTVLRLSREGSRAWEATRRAAVADAERLIGGGS